MATSSNRFPVMAGDLARLKSGGPLMAVERVFDREQPFARCLWFDARETLHSACIGLVALDLVNVEGPVTNAL